MAEPNKECPCYGDQQCWCRKTDCDCPFNMTPLSDEDLSRTAELARKYNWPKSA